jgi:LPXTG-site transpeptidase (sortase) family protein
LESTEVSPVKNHKEVFSDHNNAKPKSKPRKKATNNRLKSINKKKVSLTGLAATILVLTIYASVDTWSTNGNIKANYTENGVAGVSDSSGIDRDELEGKDETPPPSNYLETYEVSADLPRAIYVNSINVAARVLPMGVNSDNRIEAPINVFDAGWYKGSVKPGEIAAVFINAHASGQTRQGLFANLDRLSVGDEIILEKGDRTELTYRVLEVETVNLKDVDMKKVLIPKNNVLRGMNLMTCAGDWIQDSQTLDERVIVYTEQID